LSETIYASQGGYGTEREVFPAVASQFDIDRPAGEEFDQEMQIHVNNVQRQLYEISEQYEKRQITPKQWRESRSELFKTFQAIRDGELAKLGKDKVVFQNLSDEEQNEYWKMVNEAMASRGFTNKKEYIYQQYQSIRVNTELMNINEDLAFEEFFAKRKTYLDSLTESERNQFYEVRDARLNRVEREWAQESDAMQILWDWTSRGTIERTLETGKEMWFSAKTLKSEEDLKEVKLTKEKRKVFQDYLFYLNLEPMWQKDYRNPIVEQAIKAEYEKEGLKYDDRQTTDDLGRTVSVSHEAWINSVRFMIDEQKVYKTALRYNNPDIDKYYSKWFAYSPLSWSTALRNLKESTLRSTVAGSMPRTGTEMPVHETTQTMLKKHYPRVMQQGIE
jgi:hypothetical protein